MEITIKGNPKEIAALVLEIQERQMVPMHIAEESEEKDTMAVEALKGYELDHKVTHDFAHGLINAMRSELLCKPVMIFAQYSHGKIYTSF